MPVCNYLIIILLWRCAPDSSPISIQKVFVFDTQKPDAEGCSGGLAMAEPDERKDAITPEVAEGGAKTGFIHGGLLGSFSSKVFNG